MDETDATTTVATAEVAVTATVPMRTTVSADDAARLAAEIAGPFASEEERTAVGAGLHRAQDPETDAVFALDVAADGTAGITDAVSFGDADEG